jgi:pseurotin A synthetase (hybrid polyketide synthase/nonribosomal peptide synthetase)
VKRLKVDLANLHDVKGVFDGLTKVTGVIYGGASAAMANFGEDDAPLQTLQNVEQSAHNLTTILENQEVGFFIILSSLQKDRAPVNAVCVSSER